MVYIDLDKYMKHLKKDIGRIKTILKTISDNQTDSHQTLMNLLNYKKKIITIIIHYIGNKMR